MNIYGRTKLDRGQRILLLPCLCFVFSAWLFIHSESEDRISFERAKDQWRNGNNEMAIQQFQNLYKRHPKSRYAASAVWEIATIYFGNLGDDSSALYYFEQLTTEYPQSERVAESHLKMAEIFQGERADQTQAMGHWKKVLEMEISDSLRREVSFSIADACLQTQQFEEALYRFTLIIADGQDHHLVEMARGRVGNIFLIRGEYERAITMFSQVVEETKCADCRLRAQLDLIESYQHLDRFQEAVVTAKSITHPDYPRAARENLLERLGKKREYSPRLSNLAPSGEEKDHEDA